MVAGGNRDSQCLDTGNYEETSNRASWNEFQKAHLVKLLVEFHQPRARKQIGWSSVAWNEITRRFNAQFSNTNFSLKQIKEQEHTLKKQYKTIQRLRNQPGFGWDNRTKMVTAPEEVWAPLLKDKEIKRWYNKPFPYYDALHKVYCGSIATGKRQRGNNYFTNNEDEDDFLNTQGENSPISTQLNLNFAQEPSPIHPSISTSSIIASMREQMQLICASIEKKSDRTATHNEKFSVSAAVKTFEQLQGFSKGDFVIASTIFINNPRVCEVFLSCNEENRAAWIKAMIDQHKAKQKQSWEELEQDANQNQPQSKLVRVISSMENGRKRRWEELEQDANQNQSQSKLVRVISSMKNGLKRQWEELEQDANQNQPESKLVRVIPSMENGGKRLREELEQDANQNQPQWSRMRMTPPSFYFVIACVIREFLNSLSSYMLEIEGNKVLEEVVHGMRFSYLLSNCQNRQYYIEEAVPALRTQPLHIEELLTHKLVFANQVPQSIYTGNNITDNNKMPIEIQLIDINTGRQCTNVGLNIKVNIVVIDGDLELENLDSDKFNGKIVKQREGKRPLLVGNTEVAFNQQGVGTIGDIYFTDNSKCLRSGKFRLGACIDSKHCGTIIKIQEGLSEKFVVKDHRGLSYEKHYPPMLNDDIWRLESIAKDGKYHQKLKDKNFNSVQDFLKLLNAHPSMLKEEILKMPTND